MPVRHHLIYLVILSLGWSSCMSYAYYQSPLNANTSTYRAIPMQSDSVKSRFYASGSAGGGGANFRLNDGISTFSASIHRSNNFGNFQAYYGLAATGGTYDVNRVFNGARLFFNERLDTTLINSSTGTRSYFATGAFGGVNAVIPTSWGEWRIIGANFSWFREYGNYLKFRNMLHDSAANYIERRDKLFVFGFSTDFVWKTTNGSLGYKIDLEAFPSQLGFDKDGRPERVKPGNLAHTIHVENEKITAFLRQNFGYHALILTGGVNVRLGK